jgi:hypothetical protein
VKSDLVRPYFMLFNNSRQKYKKQLSCKELKYIGGLTNNEGKLHKTPKAV